MNTLVRLGRIDPKIIYVAVFLAILTPLIKPIGFPVQVSPVVRNVYDAVEALKPGDIVVMAFDYSVGGAPELWPQSLAMAKHMLKKDVRIICVAFIDQSVMYAQQVVDLYLKAGKQYGKDIVNLGYIPGSETAVAAFLSDFAKTAPKDVTGKDTAEFPIIKEANSASKVKMVAEYATGKPGPPEWVRQLAQYKVPYATGVTTSMAPQAYPYVQAGQAVGVLGGMVAAASYEALMKQPGPATKGMDAQSMGHLVVIALVLLGNIAYWAERRQKS